jgi:hypothetical protein
MKVAERRLRNKLSKLIGRRRVTTRRLKEIDDALAELGGLTSEPFASPQESSSKLRSKRCMGPTEFQT